MMIKSVLNRYAVVYTSAVLIVLLLTGFAAVGTKLHMNDFKLLRGDWSGQLTYLDYTSNEPFTMPVNVNVSMNKKTRHLYFKYHYPNEPQADETDTLVLNSQGTQLNGENVLSIVKPKKETVIIITEKEGVDGNNNRSATLRHTYLFNERIFVLKKEVRFTGEENWLIRHEYSYQRN